MELDPRGLHSQLLSQLVFSYAREKRIRRFGNPRMHACMRFKEQRQSGMASIVGPFPIT